MLSQGSRSPSQLAAILSSQSQPGIVPQIQQLAAEVMAACEKIHDDAKVVGERRCPSPQSQHRTTAGTLAVEVLGKLRGKIRPADAQHAFSPCENVQVLGGIRQDSLQLLIDQVDLGGIQGRELVGKLKDSTGGDAITIAFL